MRFVIALIVLLAWHGHAHALSCMPANAEQLAKGDDALIVGQVLIKNKVDAAKAAVNTPSEHKAKAVNYKIKVLKSWRGPKVGDVINVTGEPIASWGAPELDKQAYGYFLPLQGDKSAGYSFGACTQVIKYDRQMDVILELNRLMQADSEAQQ